METILPNDPRYFTLTSENDYDRHNYKVVSSSGKSVVVETWREAQILWWNNSKYTSYIDVLDKKEAKGFK
jgi:hypothetical protein